MEKGIIGLGLAAALAACAAPDGVAAESVQRAEEVDLAALERSRLQAFVDGNWELLDHLHADDFELVNPTGVTWSKSAYLNPMREGQWRYLVFEPVGEIRVSVNGNAGAVRYRSNLSLRIGETVLPAAHYRHTDYYERRDGRWQVVFSQATAEQ